MKLMLGYRAPVLLRLCWCFISPAIVFIAFILLLSRYEAATYEGRAYPDYAISLGLLLAVIPVLPFPICFVYEIMKRSGTLWEVRMSQTGGKNVTDSLFSHLFLVVVFLFNK